MSRVAVVTGANKGIGYHITRQLLQKEWSVVMLCRNKDLAAKAADELLGDKDVASVKGKASLHTVTFDLEAPDTFGSAAQEIKALYPDGVDSVIHNAAIAMINDSPDVFGQNAEKTFNVNVFNTIKAADALLPIVKDGGRVLFVGSRMGYLSAIPSKSLREEFSKDDATVDSVKDLSRQFVASAKDGTHDKKGFPTASYATSKIALGAYVRAFAREKRVKDHGLIVNWCCPGWCRTDMGGESAPRSVEEGADTPVWLATDPAAGAEVGQFFGERKKLDWVNGSM